MLLEKIVAQKIKEVEQAKRDVSLAELKEKSAGCINQVRDFKKAISPLHKMNLIAEIKKASPSRGLLRKDFDPVKIAQTYESCGAEALSILTEKNFFQGDIAYLAVVREKVGLPILRKDFIIDAYQIYESVCAGADSVLLIARLLSKKQLKEFCSLCAQLNLEPVCEVHNEEELDKVLDQDSAIIGINNRDLDTFEEDLDVTTRLMKKIPREKIVISESAIKSFQDVKYLAGAGVRTVLIGEAFMRSRSIPATLKQLMGR
jgi:indole-3-glycerol phosphate synthase